MVRSSSPHVEEGQRAGEGEDAVADPKDAVDAQVEPARRDPVPQAVREPHADPVVGVGAGGLMGDVGGVRCVGKCEASRVMQMARSSHRSYHCQFDITAMILMRPLAFHGD